MAEQLICNQQVVGSTPTVGSLLTMYLDVTDIGIIVNLILYGWIPEWPKGTDCKSAGTAFGGSNPPSPIYIPAKSDSACTYAPDFSNRYV